MIAVLKPLFLILSQLRHFFLMSEDLGQTEFRKTE